MATFGHARPDSCAFAQQGAVAQANHQQHFMQRLRLIQSPLAPSSAGKVGSDQCPVRAEVEELLKDVRIIAPLPRLVRTRALARARAALAAGLSRDGAAPCPPTAQILSIEDAALAPIRSARLEPASGSRPPRHRS